MSDKRTDVLSFIDWACAQNSILYAREDWQLDEMRANVAESQRRLEEWQHLFCMTDAKAAHADWADLRDKYDDVRGVNAQLQAWIGAAGKVAALWEKQAEALPDKAIEAAYTLNKCANDLRAALSPTDLPQSTIAHPPAGETK